MAVPDLLCSADQQGDEENDNNSKEMAQAGSIRENIVSSDEVGENNKDADEAKMETEEVSCLRMLPLANR